METSNCIEVWREVDGHPGYFVSNQERFRHNNRIRKGTITRNRRIVSFGRYERESFYVIVAKAFPEICGNWFEGCVVHHKDFNSLHDTPQNLVVMSSNEHSKLHYQFQSDKFKKSSKERSESISKALKGKPRPEKRIPILQYTLNGEFVKEWESVCEVEAAGYRPGNVCWCCKGKLKTAYGFKWQYK